jgi:hypothetical protein
MTNKELIALLRTYPDDARVYVRGLDAETLVKSVGFSRVSTGVSWIFIEPTPKFSASPFYPTSKNE